MNTKEATDRRGEGLVSFLLFMACIPLANWMIGNVGSTCIHEGPCLVPVAPGLMAPSGVLLVGLALVLRDIVQRRLGKYWALGAISAGAGLSALVATPALAVASTAAFFFSELADFVVYTPLEKRHFMMAVVASSLVGLLVDSAIFLYLAFGGFDFFWGQIVGKTWMVLASTSLIYWLRIRRDLSSSTAE